MSNPRRLRLTLRVLLVLCVPCLMGQGSCQKDDGSSRASARVMGPPLDRGTFFVTVRERLDGEPTKINFGEELIRRELVYHGFRAVSDPKEARYVIDGALDVRFYQQLHFEFMGQKTLLENQYKGEFEGTITDTRETDSEKRVEKFHVPEQTYGRTDDALARRDVRRKIGSDAAMKVVNTRHLARDKVKSLLDALADPAETRTFNEIAAELVAIGQPAVPYLLDALRDDREVLVKGTYPGLDDETRELFRYVHVADLALEELLDSESEFSLSSDDDYEARIVTGWLWRWEEIQQVPAAYRLDPDARRSTVPAGQKPPAKP